MKFCMAHLSTYKVPKNIYIVKELPKNASDKVLKRELKKHYS
ncbi:hypothetical protein [Acinetobacter haemolyticus]